MNSMDRMESIMKKKKVELLAPAGNYDSFIGALNAGADAVYVGGEKFSARAYADNFDTDTLCSCIKYAHLFDRKVYLTLNTLIKESEFSEIYDYVKPFYQAGLDGVIIQDFGVLRFLKKHFPGLELHASTQMAVTGPEFVSLCQELGISRVVPARELTLAELKAIRDAGIEVECFIHGAMCYCYSGMCLMSSILGGRSGNRGRCAQPCRLPYQVLKTSTDVSGEFKDDGNVACADDVTCNKSYSKECYPLSLKDMCTIEHIPALIEAGMDSFKIEGRMKRSEYAAGVTALYRKYIDIYEANPEKPFKISAKDRRILEHLYMRSELHDGYLFKHNGKEMVTSEAPSYHGLDETILEDIKHKYLGCTMKLPLSIYGYFEVEKESSLTLCTENGISVTVTGPAVQPALKAPATIESIEKQLNKLGNTHFALEHIDISLVGDAFVPNGVLNHLRREGIEQLEQAIIQSYFPEINDRLCLLKDEEASLHDYSNKDEENDALDHVMNGKDDKLTVLVRTKEQLYTLQQHPICSQMDMLYLEEPAMEAYLSQIKNIKITSKAMHDIEAFKHTQIAFAMPYILRRDKVDLIMLHDLGIRFVLVRNVESLALVLKMNRHCGCRFQIITDASLYVWNKEAMGLLQTYSVKQTLPYELNAKELRPLRGNSTEQLIYGYLPLMHSANCIFKTTTGCRYRKESPFGFTVLKDRYGKEFTVLTNCKYCYNTIYNSVPLSLHKKYQKNWQGSYRLQFSIENNAQMITVLDYYMQWMQEKDAEFPIKEYTTAHENRQVE